MFTNGLTEGPIVVMELIGADANNKWKHVIGNSGKKLSKRSVKRNKI